MNKVQILIEAPLAVAYAKTHDMLCLAQKYGQQNLQKALDIFKANKAGFIGINTSSPKCITKKLTKAVSPEGIWKKIHPTHEYYQETLIPQSFILDLEKNKSIWIHNNSTKHFNKIFGIKESKVRIFKNHPSHFIETFFFEANETKMAQGLLLQDFRNALIKITKNEIPFREIVIDNWAIEIGKSRIEGGLPSVIHAQHKYFTDPQYWPRKNK